MSFNIAGDAEEKCQVFNCKRNFIRRDNATVRSWFLADRRTCNMTM